MGGMCVGLTVSALIKYSKEGFRNAVIIGVVVYVLVLTSIIVGCQLYMRRLPTLKSAQEKHEKRL
jgi:hypothetical protein